MNHELVLEHLRLESRTLQCAPGGLEGILAAANSTRGVRPPAEAARTDAPAARQSGRGTILLVDDEELVRDLTRRMLERLGYRVLTAHDGWQALELFRVHQDDVVCALLDLTLPRMDGAQTLRELRQLRADLPAIVSSGYDQTELDRRLVDEERCDFVQKPYELAVLRNKLHEVLSGGTS